MYRHLTLAPEDLRKMSDISVSVGQVGLGSIFIPFALQEYKPEFAILGIITTCIAWVSSIYLLQEARKLEYDI